MRRVYLLILVAVYFVCGQDVIVLKSGNTQKPLAMNYVTVYERVYRNVRFEKIDSFNDTAEVGISKDSIEYLVAKGDTVRFKGSVDSRIDTTFSIFKSNAIPKQGAYRSIDEVVHNSPSAYVTVYEVKSEAEILAWRETRFAAHTLDTLEVKWIVGDCAKEHIVAYSTGDSLFFGNPSRMYYLNLHPKFSWYEAKSVVHAPTFKDVSLEYDETGRVKGFKSHPFSSNNSGSRATGIYSGNESRATGVYTKIFLVNMKNGEQKKLNKRLLVSLMGKYDKNLLAQFKKQKKKNEHLKEYFLKLLESLDKA